MFSQIDLIHQRYAKHLDLLKSQNELIKVYKILLLTKVIFKMHIKMTFQALTLPPQIIRQLSLKSLKLMILPQLQIILTILILPFKLSLMSKIST